MRPSVNKATSRRGAGDARKRYLRQWRAGNRLTRLVASESLLDSRPRYKEDEASPQKSALRAHKPDFKGRVGKRTSVPTDDTVKLFLRFLLRFGVAGSGHNQDRDSRSGLRSVSSSSGRGKETDRVRTSAKERSTEVVAFLIRQLILLLMFE